MERHGIVCIGVAGALALAGCASTREPAVAEVTAARTSVSQAEPTATRYAPEQLRIAQVKLEQAEAAFARSDHRAARWLAEEAQVDARLAMAMAQEQRMQQAVAEVNRGIETLQQQLERRSQ